MKLLLLVLFTFFTALTFGQNNYYLSNSGNDNNNGRSEQSPWKTISKLNKSNINSKDIIYFKSGDRFDDSVLECKSDIIYTTYGGSQKAIIGDSLGSLISNFTINVVDENVTLDNLKIYGYANANSVINYSANYLTITDCDIIGGKNAHEKGTRGISQSVNEKGTGHKFIRNTIRDLGFGIYITRPYNTEIAYNEMFNFFILNGRQDYGGYAFGGNHISGLNDFWDSKYTYHIHHNNIFNFEYVAFAVGSSRTIYEYNDIHHNLDERIYRGGVKHGSVGKIYDNQGSSISGLGGLGIVFRYNYIHDLIRRGEKNYTYGSQTASNVLSKTFTVTSTNNGIGHAVYLNSGYGNLAPHFGDQIDVNGKFVGEGPDKVVSGLGYGNWFIHNNLFYNCSNGISNRQYNKSNIDGSINPYRNDLGTYFVNNTIVQCGFLDYTTNSSGLLSTEASSQSPHTVINNIIDYPNSSAKYSARFREDGIYLNYNLYTTQLGVIYTNWSGYPSDGSNLATCFDGNPTILLNGKNDKYKIDPGWVDISSTFFADNIGVRGTMMPDVRLKEIANSLNEGMEFDLIGDTFIDPSGIKHNLGNDPTGRSFAYDILGNLRSTNDIGAFGIIDGSSKKIESPNNVAPTITKQPISQETSLGSTIIFQIEATSHDPIAYQWWKYNFGNDDLNMIINNEKYSGATSDILTISNINELDNHTRYLCEVYDINSRSASFINSNIVTLNIRSEKDIDENMGLIVLLEGNYSQGKMSSSYMQKDAFPKKNPYNEAPWNIEDNSVYDFNNQTWVDWVIIELRSTETKIEYIKTALLNSDGMILNPNESKFMLSNIHEGEYYLVIRHRNHLDIMSLVKVQVKNGIPINYNFTDSELKAFGKNAMAKLSDGKFGLFAGDADKNNTINNLDFGGVANNIPFRGYSHGDIDLNGIVNVLDYTFINKNILKKSYVPK